VTLQREERRFTTAGVEPSKADRWRLACVGALVAAQAWVATAHAQNAPALCATRFGLACVPSPGLPIPANGAIIIAAEPGRPVTVNVTTSQYAEVAGSLVMIAHGMWAWHATVPPAPGLYEVQVFDETGIAETVAIEFLEPAARTWPELTSAASLSQVIANEAPSCCTLDTGNGVIDFNCTTLSETTYAVLHPGLSSASSPVELNQYLFRYTAPDHSSQVAVLPWTVVAALPIYEMSDEYCYEVDAIDLVTGIIHPYRDLPARCAPHGALAPIESTVKQLADDALASPICPMPPDGFSERWCALNAEACEVDVRPRHCHFYPFTCDNQPYPGPGWRGAPSTSRDPLNGLINLIDQLNEGASDGGTADSGPRSGSGEEDASDAGATDAALEPASASDGGCTILRRREQASPSHMLLGLFAAFAWRVYRRRDR
jgi:hypothetical protein